MTLAEIYTLNVQVSEQIVFPNIPPIIINPLQNYTIDSNNDSYLVIIEDLPNFINYLQENNSLSYDETLMYF